MGHFGLTAAWRGFLCSRVGAVKLSYQRFPNKNHFSEQVEERDPNERLKALQEKALEVVELAGWRINSAFYDRVAKKLRQVSDSSDEKRNQLMDKGCEFPQHWDWQEYSVRFQRLKVLLKVFKE